MAKRKRKKNKPRKMTSWFGGFGKKKRSRKSRSGSSLKAISTAFAIVLIVAVLLAAAGAGFIVMEKYTNRSVPERVGSLELLSVPAWVNESLQQMVYRAANAGGEDLRLDAEAASSVHENLLNGVAWMDDIQVQTTHDSIRIKAKWRKPLVMVAYGVNKFYVDVESMVLDYVPLPDLPIVEVKGLAPTPRIPRPGEVFHREALVAALEILDKLDKMDKLVTPDKPLLFEIKTIDVSNYNGHNSSTSPHVLLYTKNNIKIEWGAEYGKWQTHLESSDQQKIAKLYEHYREYGTLQTNIRYINLCDPQDDILLPIDQQ